MNKELCIRVGKWNNSMIFYVTFKFNVAGTKSDIVIEVNIC